MTVGELQQLLADFDPAAEVVLATDAEGNTFSPLSDVSLGYYLEDSSYSGDFVSNENVDEDEDINVDNAPIAVALWPTN